MAFKSGDHICVLYSTTNELASAVSEFLADGLRKREQCWYVSAGSESRAVRNALKARGVDTAAQVARGALKIIPSSNAYVVHGSFNPEATIQVFNDAIEASLAAGFAGFRAAAEMSWALEANGDTDRVITYEALLRTLFANCNAIGLCLYDRRRMPLSVIDGALVTHPVLHVGGEYRSNPLYDADVRAVRRTPEAAVLQKLRHVGLES